VKRPAKSLKIPLYKTMTMYPARESRKVDKISYPYI